MNWRLAPTIGLVAMLAPAMALCSDQSRPGQVGLANLCDRLCRMPQGCRADWLTARIARRLRTFCASTTRPAATQAAALAAYVLGGRGAEPIGGAAQGRAQKPRGRAGRTRRARATRKPKPSRHQTRPSKTEEAAPAAKPSLTRSLRSSRRSNPLPGERPPTTATRGRRREPKDPPVP